MEKQLQPKLRFSDFKDDWKIFNIKEIATIIGGGTPDTSNENFWNGEINWFTPTEITKKYLSKSVRTISELGLLRSSAKILKKGTILFTSRASIGACAILTNEATTNQGFQSFNINVNNSNEFIYYWLSKNKRLFVRLSSGSTFLEISKSQIEKINLTLPSLPEQQKIADYLTTIDKKIELLEEKKTELSRYKKAMMQKLFAQEIRFKDENGNDYPEWEEKRLGEVSLRVRTKNKENNQNILTISAKDGLINQFDYYKNQYAAKDVTNYYLIEKDDFAYNKSYSKGYPYGAIKRLNKYDKGVLSTLYICFKFHRSVSELYFEQFFESGVFNKNLYKICIEGARNHGLLNVSIDDFFNEKIKLPSLPEQQKIADFLSAIDDSINKVEEQIKETQNFKKAMLQQMFV